jgi:hypothetical protein
MSAPSDKAVKAARKGALDALTANLSKRVSAHQDAAVAGLEAAHDPALGLDRSVNERWCREDQTQRIVDWLRGTGRWSTGSNDERWDAAAAVAREFGGRP